jgi:hypothetical protein
MIRTEKTIGGIGGAIGAPASTYLYDRNTERVSVQPDYNGSLTARSNFQALRFRDEGRRDAGRKRYATDRE